MNTAGRQSFGRDYGRVPKAQRTYVETMHLPRMIRVGVKDERSKQVALVTAETIRRLKSLKAKREFFGEQDPAKILEAILKERGLTGTRSRIRH